MVTVIMEEISEIFGYTEKINVHNEGEIITYCSDDAQFKEIMTCWNAMIDGSHDMPAFGVSLNDMTVKALTEDLWIEFEFGKVLECNGMPFEKLLVQVEKDYSGFNLIRYLKKAGYDGRCFYLDLVNKNMSDLYNLLINLN